MIFTSYRVSNSFIIYSCHKRKKQKRNVKKKPHSIYHHVVSVYSLVMNKWRTLFWKNKKNSMKWVYGYKIQVNCLLSFQMQIYSKNCVSNCVVNNLDKCLSVFFLTLCSISFSTTTLFQVFWKSFFYKLMNSYT